MHNGTANSGEPPDNLDFDMEFKAIWLPDETESVLNEFERLYYWNGSAPASIASTEIYRYDTATDENAYTDDEYMEGICQYYISRYHMTNQKTYRRTYHTIQATNTTLSHTHVTLARETAIQSVNYSVSEYTKNFDTGELKLTLVDV
jgi:hypothetical protein